jgi:hypothetical protein
MLSTTLAVQRIQVTRNSIETLGAAIPNLSVQMTRCPIRLARRCTSIKITEVLHYNYAVGEVTTKNVELKEMGLLLN